VDSADVGVIQCGCGLPLALEASQSVRVARDIVGQELQGNMPVQPDVFSLIHHSHASTTELGDDAVVRDGLADQKLVKCRMSYGGDRYW
jgi:hypothetical protein